MLSDRPFADASPIRLSVPTPKPRRAFTAEELRQISRELNADHPAATDGAGPAGAAPTGQDPSGFAPAATGQQRSEPVAAAAAEAAAAPVALAKPAAPQPAGVAERPEARRIERLIWRHACNWLELHRICRQARCRHAGRCRGNPETCLRAGVRLAPQPARDFVRSMMQAQELGLSFEEAFEDAADHREGYCGWITGLWAAAKR